MHRTYPSQLDGGQAYTLGLQLLMAKNLSVAVDDAALADTERVEEAAREHGLDLSRSWMVGDKTSDIACGRNARMRTVLVETGHGKDHLDCGADAIVPDIGYAADFILREAGSVK